MHKLSFGWKAFLSVKLHVNVKALLNVTAAFCVDLKILSFIFTDLIFLYVHAVNALSYKSASSLKQADRAGTTQSVSRSSHLSEFSFRFK